MKKVFVFMIGIFLLISFSSAQLMSFTFNVNQDRTENVRNINSKNFVLQVSTTEAALCRYSQNTQYSFDSMSAFDENYEVIHKKTFSDLEDGFYRFYVKCVNRTTSGSYNNYEGTLEVSFIVTNPIAGQIVMDSGKYLSVGKYPLRLVTTKIPTGEPKLSYSFDGVIYSPVVLRGSGREWEGFLFVGENQKEGVGTFRFEATDLENRKGNELFGDTTFFVDTKAPKTISVINAVGKYGEVELNWHMDEDVEKFLIYRSEQRGVDESSLYVEVSGSRKEYLDTSVTKGKTYYYRVSSKDKAGNIAVLSREVEATVLMSESSSSQASSGLALNLHGLVDNLLVEIGIFEDDLKSVEQKSRSDNEKKIYEGLGLKVEVDSLKTEIDSVKREVQNYKLQDLTKESLETRLSSSQVKLNLLKKRLPDRVNILEEKEIQNSLNEEAIRRVGLEHISVLTDKEISRKVKSTQKFIEEKGFKISGKGFLVEVVYLDGTKKDFSFFEHNINSIAETNKDFRIFLSLPSGLLGSSRLKVNNREYTNEKENLVSFGVDNKGVSYSVERRVSLDLFDDIVISPLDVRMNEEVSGVLTGYSVFNFGEGLDFNGFGILIFLVLGLFGYLAYMKFSKKQENGFVGDFINKARMVKELQKQGRMNEANDIYNSLKVDYLSMDVNEKKKVFKEIKLLGGGK